MLTTSLPIEIYISVSGLRGSHTSYLHSFSLKSPSTQTSSYHQFYSFIMEKSSNHQLLNGKISISSFPKFSISTAFKAQIHQIITKFKPNLQSTGNPNPPPFYEVFLHNIQKYRNKNSPAPAIRTKKKLSKNAKAKRYKKV